MLIIVIQVVMHMVNGCPSDCQCTMDPEYEDGVLVDCENLGLVEIPVDIPGDVTTLLLSYNNIKNIDDLSYYNNLRSLELQHNYLQELDPSVFQSLSYLKILVLSENLLEKIPDRVFRGLQYLEWVDFRGNKINYISPRAFSKAHNINYLNLVDNKISYIEDSTFLPLTTHSLWLMLSKNSLSELPNDIARMRGIQYLSVSHNKLTHIAPHALTKNVNLRTLDISYNRISYLHKGTFSGIRLQKLESEGNPWKCDCYLEWLRLYLLSRQVQQYLMCSTPYQSTLITSIDSPLLCSQPVVVAPEPEKRVLEHRNSTLSCLVTGDPTPVVHWFKDGKELEAQANRYTELVGSEHRLVFRSVLYTDGGVYNCTAENGRDPPTTASIIFSVLFAPKFINSYKWSPIDEDATSDVTLSCDAVSNPPLSKPIIWNFEDKELKGTEEGVKITWSGSGSTIYLTHSPNTDHSGTYTCVATNSLGRAQESFHVTSNDMLMLSSSAPGKRKGGSYHHHITPILILSLIPVLILT